MTTPVRPVINIDLDNVVSDFSTEINIAGESALGRRLQKHGQWDIAKQWDVPTGLYKRIFRQGVSEGRIWLDAPVVEGALEGLWALSDAEYYIRILTHRLNHGFDFRVAVQNTIEWLDKNHVPYRSLAVIGDEPKSNYKAEALLDDAPHNIEDWLDATLLPGEELKYSTAVVFDRPWNHDLNPFIPRAKDWPDAVTKIREIVGL